MASTSYTTTRQHGLRHVTVHRPELTAEERERRMADIKQAAINLVVATEKAKRGRGRTYHEPT